MCYNCGCQMPDDTMGNPSNITNDTFKTLAKRWDKSFEETQKMVKDMLAKGETNKDFEEVLEKAAKAWGQSIDEAKQNTLELLTQEMRN